MVGGKKTQQMILGNMWKLYEIPILVSRNKISLEQTCLSFTGPTNAFITTGRVAVAEGVWPKKPKVFTI